jgi:hypothetical protein
LESCGIQAAPGFEFSQPSEFKTRWILNSASRQNSNASDFEFGEAAKFKDRTIFRTVLYIGALDRRHRWRWPTVLSSRPCVAASNRFCGDV